MSDEMQKKIEINGKHYSIVRMNAFDAIHFKLRMAELLTKHGVNLSGSLVEAVGRVFSMLNEQDHDEVLFRLLNASQAQCLDNDLYLDGWEALNITYKPADVTDVYLLGLECIKFSILPVVEGLKKNIGLDMSLSVTEFVKTLSSGLLQNLTLKSSQSSPSGE